MKKISFIIIVVFGLMTFFSCEKEEKLPIAYATDGPSFETPASGNAYVLTEENAAAVFAVFSWDAADFGFASATTYTLQMDVSGNEFADATDIASTSDSELSFTVGEMNNKFLAMGLLSDVASQLEARIVATIHDDVETLYSATLAMTVTPYEMIVDYPKLYVPGSHQGWDPSNVNTVLASLKSDNKYEGYIYFADANTQFKFNPAPNWDNDWGDDGADGTLDAKGANIEMAEAGYYKFNVNINDLTWTGLKTEWGLIGSATPDGWDSDQDLTYDAENDVWTITLDLIVGEIKFRANDGWDLDYGDTGGDKKLEAGGDNIAIGEAGNYTITLNLGVPPIYRYTVVKN